MANTTTRSGSLIQITGLDANWVVDVDAPEYSGCGVWVRSITVVPSATDDVFIIRAGPTVATCTAGATIFHEKFTSVYDTRTRTFADKGLHCFPGFIISQCTLNTAANAKVIIELA